MRQRRWRLLLAALAALGLLYSSLAAPLATAAAFDGDALDVSRSLSGVAHRAPAPSEPDVEAQLDAPEIGEGIKQLSVIGDDERVPTDTMIYPATAIALLEVSGAAYDGICTGTFIGPTVLLTAAHCLYSLEDGWVDYVRVIPGKDGEEEPFGSEYAQWYWIPDESYYGDDGEWDWTADWGLVVLPSDELGNAVGWLEIGVLSTASLSAPSFQPVISGYPGDKPYGTQWFGSQAAFDDVDETYLWYSIDTAEGMSGSAVLRGSDGLITGVHIAGVEGSEQPFNSARRIDQLVLNGLLGACADIGCEIAYRVEQAPDPGQTLYSSTLGDWAASSYAGGSTYHGRDGSLRMRVRPGDGSYTLARTTLAGFADAVVAVDVRLTSGTGDALGCLMTRVDPAESFDYALCIDSQGRLSAFAEYFDESGYHTVQLLHGEIISDRPARVWNRLTVVAAGSDFWFYANDVLLGIATHPGLAAGAAGMTVVNHSDRPVEFAFANLTVQAVN